MDEDATVLFDESDLGITLEEDLSFDNPSPQALRIHAAHKNAQKENLFILRNIINNMKKKLKFKQQVAPERLFHGIHNGDEPKVHRMLFIML